MWSNTTTLSTRLHIYVTGRGSVQYSGKDYCHGEDKLPLFLAVDG